MYENSENRGILNFESTTKKVMRNFWEKVKLGKCFTESEKFSEIGRKSETGGKCIFASGGMDAPGYFPLSVCAFLCLFSTLQAPVNKLVPATLLLWAL